MNVTVGIYVDLRNPPEWERPWSTFYGSWLERITAAEQLGVGSVWLSEHHLFEDGYLTQPLVYAAAIAARTKRIRIGTAVLLAPLRTAPLIAEEAIVVDLVSGGRLELGVGAGYRVPEFELFGANPLTPVQAAIDRLTDLERLLSDDRLTPRPLQSPFPLWGGFSGRRGAKAAGRLGVGLLSAVPNAVRAYQEGLAEAGHPPERARFAVRAPIFLADDPEAAWARLAKHYAHQQNTYAAYAAEGRPDPSGTPDLFATMAPGTYATSPVEGVRGHDGIDVLTVDEAAAFIEQRYGDLPVEHVFCWASVSSAPDELVERHIELVAALATQVATQAGHGVATS